MYVEFSITWFWLGQNGGGHEGLFQHRNRTIVASTPYHCRPTICVPGQFMEGCCNLGKPGIEVTIPTHHPKERAHFADLTGSRPLHDCVDHA